VPRTRPRRRLASRRWAPFRVTWWSPIAARRPPRSTIGKKTYSFKNGYCRKGTHTSIPLSLTLGEIVGVHSPVNGGQPLFEMTVLTIGKLMSPHVNADSGGKVLDAIGTVALRYPSSGTSTSAGLATPALHRLVEVQRAAVHILTGS